jgi:hypothetical protein
VKSGDGGAGEHSRLRLLAVRAHRSHTGGREQRTDEAPASGIGCRKLLPADGWEFHKSAASRIEWGMMGGVCWRQRGNKGCCEGRSSDSAKLFSLFGSKFPTAEGDVRPAAAGDGGSR